MRPSVSKEAQSLGSSCMGTALNGDPEVGVDGDMEETPTLVADDGRGRVNAQRALKPCAKDGGRSAKRYVWKVRV